MPNTTPDNIYYPDNQTAVDDLAGLFAAQATSVQAALASMRTALTPVPITDSGWTLNGLTLAAGWTGIADSSGNSGTTGLKGGMRKVGNRVELRFRATRSGVALTANAQGNIGDNIVCTINNTPFRPAGSIYATYDFGPGIGTGGCRIESDGNIYIVDAYPTAQIKPGQQIQVTANYFTG
jgi:hypothetical protein